MKTAVAVDSGQPVSDLPVDQIEIPPDEPSTRTIRYHGPHDFVWLSKTNIRLPCHTIQTHAIGCVGPDIGKIASQIELIRIIDHGIDRTIGDPGVSVRYIWLYGHRNGHDITLGRPCPVRPTIDSRQSSEPGLLSKDAGIISG